MKGGSRFWYQVGPIPGVKNTLFNEHKNTLWGGKYTRFELETYEDNYVETLLWGMDGAKWEYCWDLDSITLWKEVCEKSIGWADFTISPLPGNNWRRFFHKIIELPKEERIPELRSILEKNLINTTNE